MIKKCSNDKNLVNNHTVIVKKDIAIKVFGMTVQVLKKHDQHDYNYITITTKDRNSIFFKTLSHEELVTCQHKH